MDQNRSYNVIVIGAGLVGVSTALALQQAGRSVLLVDRNEPGMGASLGNAGAFAFTDIVPLATPGMIKSAPKWLLDPLGPLSIPPSYALSIAPWLLKFWRASWQNSFPKLMAAQVELMDLSRAALERQIADIDGEHLIRREGQLKLFHGERSFRNSASYWDACRNHGIKFDLLNSAGEIADIQPGINPEFTHAGFTPDWLNTTDPKLWLDHLLHTFRTRGGEFQATDAQRLETVSNSDTKSNLGATPNKVIVHCDQGTFTANQVVVSAGAWSRKLALSLGDNIPLETERGYNTTFKACNIDIKTHLTFADHGFVVSRIQNGVRVGGAVELGGLKAAPNFKRSKDMLNKANRFIPGLTSGDGEQWMGFRPSMPDSLPVIGQSSTSDNVIYAFGHGHLGLTQSAGTAELVRALVVKEGWPINSAPFSAQRF